MVNGGFTAVLTVNGWMHLSTTSLMIFIGPMPPPPSALSAARATPPPKMASAPSMAHMADAPGKPNPNNNLLLLSPVHCDGDFFASPHPSVAECEILHPAPEPIRDVVSA